MSFRSHLENITTKAARMLNFLHRNLYRCDQEVKCMAYIHLVILMLEYASCVWDPYFDKDINALEMLQRRATQWVTLNYDRQSGISISSTLEDLQWPSLSQRRQTSRIKLFYKAVHHTSALKIPDYYDQGTLVQSTGSYHRYTSQHHFINANSYKFSYFPRTINE